MTQFRKTLPYLLTACCVWLFTTSQAQQDPMFSQYMFNTLSINPAYAGSADYLSASGIYRTQWVTLEGAPVTQTITAHAPLSFESVSVGGSIVNDSHGPVDQLAIYGDASYRIFMGNKRLAFGLKAGINLMQADLVGLNPIDEGDIVFQQNITNKLLPNFGAGVMYYSDRFYVGVSVPKLLQNEFSEATTQDFAQSLEKQHFFFIAGKVWDVSNYVRFKPSILVKATGGVPPSVDLTANFLFYDKFWAGVMYRWEDAAGILLQYEINHRFRLGYAFDYTLSELTNYNNGTHEVMLGFDLRDGIMPDKSPRFF